MTTPFIQMCPALHFRSTDPALCMVRVSVTSVIGNGRLYSAAPTIWTVCKIESLLLIARSPPTGTSVICGTYRHCFWSRCRRASGKSQGFPEAIPRRYTTVFSTPPSAPITRRSRSRVPACSGSHVAASFVIGNVIGFGRSPVHLTTREIVPPSGTLTTWYTFSSDVGIAIAKRVSNVAAISSLPNRIFLLLSLGACLQFPDASIAPVRELIRSPKRCLLLRYVLFAGAVFGLVVELE